MNKRIINKKINKNTLVGINEVYEILKCGNFSLWGFKNITIQSAYPFKLSAIDFEILTSTLKRGVIVTDYEFEKLLIDNNNIQLIDGFINGYLTDNIKSPDLILNCFDTSFYEIETDLIEIIKTIDRYNLIQ